MTAGDGDRKIVGVGLAVLDHLLLWQDAGRAVRDNRITDYQVQGGGMVATAMVAAARLGARAEYWGAVGDDWMGTMILDGLRAENVDTRGVVRVAGASGPTVIVCVDKPTGERHFLYGTGLPDPASPLFAPEDLSSAGCVLIDGTYTATALAAATEARRRGIPVVGDYGSPSERVRSLLPHTDYAIVSEAFARRLGEDIHAACRQVRAMGPRCVVVTRGAKGLVCLAEDGCRGLRSAAEQPRDCDERGCSVPSGLPNPRHQDEAAEDVLELPAFPVEVVDTTGAGDVFHGAFCVGLLRGWPLEMNLRFASAVAAMKCRRLGGRAGIPTFDEVASFLAERGVTLP